MKLFPTACDPQSEIPVLLLDCCCCRPGERFAFSQLFRQPVVVETAGLEMLRVRHEVHTGCVT